MSNEPEAPHAPEVPQAPERGETPDAQRARPAETVASLSALYLGNILYALESTAVGFENGGQADHAAFYRAIARKLAEARGREKR